MRASMSPLRPTPDDAIEADWPTLQYFALVRVLISTAMLLGMMFGLPVLGHAMGTGPGRVMTSLGTYFALSMALVAWPIVRRSRFGLQIWAHLAVDLALISLLVALGGGMPSVVAFFVCSIVDLILLSNEVLRGLGADPGEAQLFQAGVVGAALFGITALLCLLSKRLSRQEQLARARGRELESQLQINRLVISQMEQGVIVADADTRVRANNRAARVMLGFDPDAQLTGRRLLELAPARELGSAYLNWLVSAELNETAPQIDRVIQGGEMGRPGPPRRLRVRFARPAFKQSGEYVI